MANLKTKYVTMGCEFVDAELLREAVELLKLELKSVSLELEIKAFTTKEFELTTRKNSINQFIKKATE